MLHQWWCCRSIRCGGTLPSLWPPRCKIELRSRARFRNRTRWPVRLWVEFLAACPRQVESYQRLIRKEPLLTIPIDRETSVVVPTKNSESGKKSKLERFIAMMSSV